MCLYVGMEGGFCEGRLFEYAQRALGLHRRTPCPAGCASPRAGRARSACGSGPGRPPRRSAQATPACPAPPAPGRRRGRTSRRRRHRCRPAAGCRASHRGRRRSFGSGPGGTACPWPVSSSSTRPGAAMTPSVFPAHEGSIGDLDGRRPLASLEIPPGDGDLEGLPGAHGRAREVEALHRDLGVGVERLDAEPDAGLGAPSRAGSAARRSGWKGTRPCPRRSPAGPRRQTRASAPGWGRRSACSRRGSPPRTRCRWSRTPPRRPQSA